MGGYRDTFCRGFINGRNFNSQHKPAPVARVDKISPVETLKPPEEEEPETKKRCIGNNCDEPFVKNKKDGKRNTIVFRL